MKIVCPLCEKELSWGGDNDAEDYGLPAGLGIVSNFSCTCGVYAEAFFPLEKGVNRCITYYVPNKENQ